MLQLLQIMIPNKGNSTDIHGENRYFLIGKCINRYFGGKISYGKG